MGGLFFHLLHQPRALDDVRKTRIVFHVGGDGELATGLDALDQDRFKHGPRRVDRSGVAAGAGTVDYDLGMDGGRHRADPSLKGIWSARRWNAPAKAIAAARKV